LKPYVLVFSFTFVFLLLSSFKLGAFNASKKQVNFPVTNLVPKLAIVNIDIQDHYVLLSLRNDSDKNITAFSLSSSGVNLRAEMIGTDRVMRPGDIHTKLCDLPSPKSTEKGIIVLAVVYEDGTWEGDDKYVRQILDARAGTQAQLARVLPLFRDALTTPKNMRLMQKREMIRYKIEQLTDEEEGKSFEYRMGLHDEKERAMNNLKQLEQIEQEKGEDIARQVLPHIINNYEKRNVSLLNSLKQVR
jgi:hypothetical protein